MNKKIAVISSSFLALVMVFGWIGCEQKTKEKIVYREVPGDPGIPPDPPGKPPVDPPVDPPGEPPVDPPDPPTGGLVRFEQFEEDTLNFLNRLNDNDQLNTRFLSVCEQQNLGKPIGNYVKAVDKAINSISFDRDVEKSQAVAGTECLRAIDVTDYGLNAADWDLIVQANPFLDTFESFTSEGLIIKGLTGENQSWMPAHIFIFTAFDAPVYYELLDLPADLGALQAQLGLDLQANFDDEDRDTYLFGHTGSQIALGKNRMHLRTEIDDGHYYQSYDAIVANVGLADRNIFQSPFPVEARSDNTFIPDGHEVIFSLPNGLHAYYLSDGNGFRQDFAPLDLVVDTEAAAISLDPTIRILSCARCHATGLIERRDEIFDKVRRDNNFDIVDVQKSEFWHGRVAEMSGEIRSDNQRFQNALRETGSAAGDTDFVNFYTDKLRKESSLNQVAALMFLSPDEFSRRLDLTVVAKNQIGSLDDGKTIAFEQLQTALAEFVVEANIFRDDFGK